MMREGSGHKTFESIKQELELKNTALEKINSIHSFLSPCSFSFSLLDLSLMSLYLIFVKQHHLLMLYFFFISFKSSVQKIKLHSQQNITRFVFSLPMQAGYLGRFFCLTWELRQGLQTRATESLFNRYIGW